MNQWMHTVLELYTLDGPWPTEGRPADWIEQELVAYCQGDDETVVIFTPLPRILWWKLKDYAYQVQSIFASSVFASFWYDYTPWGRQAIREMDAWLDSLPIAREENPGKHIASPATAREIRDAVGCTEEDVEAGLAALAAEDGK